MRHPLDIAALADILQPAKESPSSREKRRGASKIKRKIDGACSLFFAHASY